jgi:hypothetical protein
LDCQDLKVWRVFPVLLAQKGTKEISDLKVLREKEVWPDQPDPLDQEVKREIKEYRVPQESVDRKVSKVLRASQELQDRRDLKALLAPRDLKETKEKGDWQVRKVIKEIRVQSVPKATPVPRAISA